jgi:hypothetical protein
MPYILHTMRMQALGVKPMSYAAFQSIAVAITRLAQRESTARTFHNSRSN